MPDGTVSGTNGSDLINTSYVGDPEGDLIDNNDNTGPGDPNDDVVEAGAGDDTVYAGEGADSVNGGTGSDTIYGEAGNDYLETGTGGSNDTIYGGDGDDFIIDEGNSSSDDILDGGAGNDEILGGDGDDTIYGGVGADGMTGSDGDDVFVLFDNYSTDASAPEPGSDFIDGGIFGESTGDVLDATGVTGDSVLEFGGGSGGTLPEGGDPGSGDPGSGDPGAGDPGTGDPGSGEPGGGEPGGGDGGGDHLLTTGTDSAEITNIEIYLLGSGDDLVIDDSDGHTVDMGAGDDTFQLSDSFGNDDIDGGSAGESLGDTLDGSALTEDITVSLSSAGDGTYSNGLDTATFADIENISTGSGSDTITGSSGDDNFNTGSGDDSVSAGAGSDTIVAGAGDDTVDFDQGDSVDGGDGNDTFTLTDFGSSSTDAVTIDGGSGDETTGDTLVLGDLADLSTLSATDDGTGSFSGSVTLDSGAILNFTDIESIICFTPGTRIATPQGARDIADLKVGDLVVTRDHGLQPIRWIQSRTVPAVDKFAPIRIRPGTVTGLQKDILVSPQHRMLFKGYRAELLYGETEVLVAAKHLIDDKFVTRDEGGDVTYIHMMFDEHEIVYAEGAATESFHPGKVGLNAVSDEAREELFTLFPELRSNPNGYGDTARRCLKNHETQLLHI